MAIVALLATLFALWMNYRQYREFNRRLKARARFSIDLAVVDADQEGIRWIDRNVTNQFVRISIGVENVGEKAAGETVINALFPRGIHPVRWAGPGGEERPVEALVAQASDGDQLFDGVASYYPADYLSRTLPRVGTRPHSALYFQFPVEMPHEILERRVPIRVKAQADELPDDIDEYEASTVVRVKRRV